MKRTMKNNLKGLRRVAGGMVANGDLNSGGRMQIRDDSVVDTDIKRTDIMSSTKTDIVGKLDIKW